MKKLLTCSFLLICVTGLGACIPHHHGGYHKQPQTVVVTQKPKPKPKQEVIIVKEKPGRHNNTVVIHQTNSYRSHSQQHTTVVVDPKNKPHRPYY